MNLVPRYRFERLVADALDDLPDDLAAVLDNVVVQVADRHPDEPDLLGLYEGVPHTERTGHEGPDVVSIYRLALCELCEDEDDLAEEVYVTVIHELLTPPASTTTASTSSAGPERAERDER